MSFLCLTVLACATAAVDPPAPKYFKITVLDDQTGRGVPLVELQTVHNLRYVSDSNGVVAFHEPGLMDQKVFFHVKSHGYEFPKDGFGYRGVALEVKEGGSAVLKIKRINIAERLYRVTGAGIYRDSVLVGDKVPLDKPLLNAQVLGTDSAVSALYRGKIWWFWGDTDRASYPLGNFEVPGATSELPGKGGLDPRLGVNLTYFLDDKGFARKMTAIPGKGPTWIQSLVLVQGAKGQERMFAIYVKIRGSLEVVARGLANFDDDKLLFESVAEFDLKAPLQPQGHTFNRVEDGVEYVYFCHPFPLVRVRPSDLARQDKYEAFTCLKEGSRPDDPQLDRAADGALRWGWKTNAPVLTAKEQARLLKKGLLKPGETLVALQDADTGQRIQTGGGSVYWNEYRRRWVMIAVQTGGTSYLGEVWYAEADTPLGPWVYAARVVTHDKYSFYNPKQHPLFDRDSGRWIFFEGTYSHTFSGTPDQTPRYDYNQVMYQLDLADPRLVVPVPVYDLLDKGPPGRFASKAALDAKAGTRPIAFFALDRPRPGSLPVYFQEAKDGGRLVMGKAPDAGAAVVFHALPTATEKPPVTATPLWEFVHKDGKQRAYTIDAAWTSPGFAKTAVPVCLVWRSPLPRHLDWPVDAKR
jgi:hypothetical protein